MFNSSIEYGWLLFMAFMVGISLLLIKIIKLYLKSKAEGRSSLMDQAHMLLFNNLKLISATFFLQGVLREILILNDWREVAGHGFEVWIHTLRLSTVLFVMIDLAIQFILTTNQTRIIDMPLSESKVITIIQWVIYAISFIIFLIINLSGNNSMVYYGWIGEFGKDNSKPVMIIHSISLLTAIIIGITLRIILKFRSSDSLPSHQILSNKAIICWAILLYTFIIIRRPIILPHERFYVFHSFINSFLFLVILFHPGLRDFALSKVSSFIRSLFTFFESIAATAAEFSAFPFSVRFTPIVHHYNPQ